MTDKINILGTEYSISIKSHEEDEAFARLKIDGYCDGFTKQIVICNLHTYDAWSNEPKETTNAAIRSTLRHEIVHAFLNESGLCESTFRDMGAWARNEEMVDWIALQGEKIYKAWLECDCV